ncbi:hypothetical protein [Listeria phage LMTA-34]|uniref:Uncharacterized protein n=1 Tax=Listeria phage LMTA-34 TaxID=1486397 RepID=A0A068C6T0_9CAUD|nr:hypothetical protein FDI77_gp027 [Listeria phage LMTA-34]AID16928.1 hypothetical protein [Listeria phage LMTA-34]
MKIRYREIQYVSQDRRRTYTVGYQHITYIYYDTDSDLLIIEGYNGNFHIKSQDWIGRLFKEEK